MNKEFWKDFYKWVEAASDEELVAKKEELVQLLDQLYDPDYRGDVSRMIRDIEEEQVARAHLSCRTPG